MRATRVSAYVFAAAASLAGCMGTGEVEYAGAVHVSSPELIELQPGVMVVADADEPLFYAVGYYWLYRDGYWLRSNDYRRGFVRVELSYVPQRIRVIDRPQVYVQYRRHHRDYSARAGQQPVRTRPAPGTYPPPPNQGVPSTPPADTWQPPVPGIPPTGVNPVPTRPQPTPPITSPSDVHGRPINVDRPYGDSTGPDRVPPGQQDPVTPPGQARPDQQPRTPPGQAGRPGPQPTPPAPDRGDRPNRGENRGNSQGTASDRDDQATPPSPPSPGHGHGAKDDRDKDDKKKKK